MRRPCWSRRGRRRWRCRSALSALTEGHAGPALRRSATYHPPLTPTRDRSAIWHLSVQTTDIAPNYVKCWRSHDAPRPRSARQGVDVEPFHAPLALLGAPSREEGRREPVAAVLGGV